MTPLLNASLDLDLRVVHHDYNIHRLQALFEKYGPTAATTEHIGDECLLILCSQLPDKSTDEFIAGFAIEPMRDYLTRRDGIASGRCTEPIRRRANLRQGYG